MSTVGAIQSRHGGQGVWRESDEEHEKGTDTNFTNYGEWELLNSPLMDSLSFPELEQMFVPVPF